jgi:hypothetical protein
MRIAIHAVCAFVMVSANMTLAQISTPAEGDYVINDGVWGTLQVQPRGKFRIETIGANGHTCELDGVIIGGKSTPQKSECQVTFSSDGPDVNVTTNGGGKCVGFCGARSWFEGRYRKPPPSCENKKVQATRKQFQREYQTKNYSAALETIKPVAAQCKQFLYWIDLGWVLNDLALTQFKLGDRASCIRTLQSLAPDAALSDEQITGKFPPADSDMYLPVVHATRTNLKLCSRR